MKQSVFFVLLISGLCTLCTCLRQYHFVNITKNWTEAQSYCRENYADLATIDNQEEMKALMGVVGFNDVAWIGLYDDVNSWQWSDSHVEREGQTEFRNWGDGNPDNANSSENCAVMLISEGVWHDISCETRNGPFVCYNENNQEYLIVEKEFTWREAQKHCREEYTDLVSVRNQSDNNRIEQEAEEQGKTGGWVWIGLFRESWKWSDQSNSSYRNWSTGQPDNEGGNENCVGMLVGATDSGKWDDRRCNETHPFFCHGANLILVRENKSWEDALDHCRDLGGDLASVTSGEMQHWVERKVQNASTAHVWLGLRYSCTLNFWFWVSGEGFCYQKWAERAMLGRGASTQGQYKLRKNTGSVSTATRGSTSSVAM
ncbi:hypothetical protein AGOR_G00193880 [Albula goreensis]|uniref:C-type lectin domain-containing protein n=1 Tax=Albula goreensis TaxID=1534307 RepID=A0A8T3CVK1_9TELE|nr:hypothetical protein AGOR_G00193880 [Albula goreensis]